MRLRNTLFALIVLAGLACFIYYYEYKGGEQRRAAEEAEKNLLTFERDKVVEVDIRKPDGGVLTLRKESDRWQVSAEPGARTTRADTDKVDSILSTLSFLRIDRKLEGVGESELADFKLKEPAVRLTLKQEAGKPDIEVSLGDKAPVGGALYALRSGSPDVMLVTGGADSILTADLSTLRYKKVVGLDAWKVARFGIQRGAEALTLRHGAPGTQEPDWRLERPVSFPADSSKAQSLWFDLQSAEAESFESEQPLPSDLERFGLARPSLSLTVEPKEGDAPLTVSFGAAGPSGPHYARRSDMAAVMKVKPDLIEKLDKALSKPDDLRDPRIVPIDRYRLSSLEIGRPPAVASLQKDDASKWRWGGKDGLELPSEDVNALVDALEEAKATGFLDGAGGPPAGEPALTLTAREGSGEEGRAITVRIAPDGSEPAGRRVSSSETPTVYIVPPAAIQKLIERAAAIREPAPPQAQTQTAAPPAEPATPASPDASGKKADQ